MKRSLFLLFLACSLPVSAYAIGKKVTVGYINLLILETAEALENKVEPGGVVMKSFRLKPGSILMVRVAPKEQKLNLNQREMFREQFSAQLKSRDGVTNFKSEVLNIDGCAVDYYLYEEISDLGTGYASDYVTWCDGRMGLISFADMNKHTFKVYNRLIQEMELIAE
ncbi:hypothetical protein [Kangiella sediminilitoris]|uniref:Uncharacterized protein n=1 Tax=Kangiella sediminilitoris TaxID=1144748 RepID=A0A1B3BAZ1_9GAMM|nr:hypothetical protein [Kangiella sediminilitoris]AOE49934.1 hypothetical protein KS2013_1215 [Kangiella sediminilitoris]